jgi:hypothetical protein
MERKLQKSLMLIEIGSYNINRLSEGESVDIEAAVSKPDLR